MEVRPAEVLKHLMLDLGIMATITQSIDSDTARQVAENFEVEVRVRCRDDRGGREERRTWSQSRVTREGSIMLFGGNLAAHT